MKLYMTEIMALSIGVTILRRVQRGKKGFGGACAFDVHAITDTGDSLLFKGVPGGLVLSYPAVVPAFEPLPVGLAVGGVWRVVCGSLYAVPRQEGMTG